MAKVIWRWPHQMGCRLANANESEQSCNLIYVGLLHNGRHYNVSQSFLLKIIMLLLLMMTILANFIRLRTVFVHRVRTAWPPHGRLELSGDDTATQCNATASLASHDTTRQLAVMASYYTGNIATSWANHGHLTPRHFACTPSGDFPLDKSPQATRSPRTNNCWFLSPRNATQASVAQVLPRLAENSSKSPSTGEILCRRRFTGFKSLRFGVTTSRMIIQRRRQPGFDGQRDGAGSVFPSFLWPSHSPTALCFPVTISMRP